MSTGLQLSAWCKKQGVKNFHGVFSSNTLPTPYQPHDACFIVNHSPTTSPSGGSHWLACRIQGNKAQWFDSYGMPPHAVLENEMMGSRSDAKPHFDEWLKRCGVEHVSYNEHDLQSVTSDVCGQYACYFCAHGLPAKGNRAWSWLSLTNVLDNDATIRKLVRLPADKT